MLEGGTDIATARAQLDHVDVRMTLVIPARAEARRDGRQKSSRCSVGSRRLSALVAAS